MKKLLAPLLALLLLASCAGPSPALPPETTGAAPTERDGGQPVVRVPNEDLSGAAAEFDLTALDTQMAYVQLSNMMLSPEDYIGKTVKLRGKFAHAAEDGREFFVCYLMDATACCSQSLEFETDEAYAFPEAYPPEQSEITVCGVFDTYEYNGFEMYRLLHAELSY